MVIPAAIDRVQKLYNVIRYTTPLKAPPNKPLCGGKPLPVEVTTVGIPNTDLYIMINWVHNTTAKFVAKATACARDATTNR